MTEDLKQPVTYLSLPAVMARVPVSRATIFRWVRTGHLPAPRRIGPNRIAWRESDIDAWCAERPAARAENAWEEPNHG